jgi:hypothetical protein
MSVKITSQSTSEPKIYKFPNLYLTENYNKIHNENHKFFMEMGVIKDFWKQYAINNTFSHYKEI